MAAPEGTNPDRWQYAVTEVAAGMSWDEGTTDSWLEEVWANMWTANGSDVAAGSPEAYIWLRTALEDGPISGVSPTFQRSFHDWAVDPAPPPPSTF